jgi:hypothetical protein
VSVDQYASSVPGRLPHTMGKEPSKLKYHGSTGFVDHASSLIFLVNQSSLRVEKPYNPKLHLKDSHKYTGISFGPFMPFDSNEFEADLVPKGQDITFSGVGADHQNGIAERAIQTVTQWARLMLFHQALHWPE